MFYIYMHTHTHTHTHTRVHTRTNTDIHIKIENRRHKKCLAWIAVINIIQKIICGVRLQYKKPMCILGEISGSYGGKYENDCVLGYCTV
jgi:hypothetical protein